MDILPPLKSVTGQYIAGPSVTSSLKVTVGNSKFPVDSNAQILVVSLPESVELQHCYRHR